MSTFKHRQPIINWSSVVLLSTLLLSPMTAASVLHVLAQAFPHVFTSVAPGVEGDCPATRAADDRNASAPESQSPSTPRRDNDEQEALRRAVAKASRLRAVRFDTDPHALLRDLASGTTISVRVPTRTLFSVADTAAASPLRDWPTISDALACSRIIGPAPARAPPVA